MATEVKLRHPSKLSQEELMVRVRSRDKENLGVKLDAIIEFYSRQAKAQLWDYRRELRRNKKLLNSIPIENVLSRAEIEMKIETLKQLIKNCTNYIDNRELSCQYK